MPIERYCSQEGCLGGDHCINPYRVSERGCSKEYVAAYLPEDKRWKGEGPPPSRWWADDGTLVYRSYSDYVG